MKRNIYVIASENKKKFIAELLNNSNFEEDLKVIDVQLDIFQNRIIDQVVEGIKISDIVIADITDNNPNVFFEIGIAQANKKRIILLNEVDKNDIKTFQFYPTIQYKFNKSETDKIVFKLKEQLKFETKKVDRKRVIEFNTNEISHQFLFDDEIKGAKKYYELERWVYDLFKGINGFDVNLNERRSGKEYDLIIWNNNPNDLEYLGNPFPVEIKSTKIITNSFIDELITKAELQGFKSLILMTTSFLQPKIDQKLKFMKNQNGFLLLTLDFNDLKKITTSADLYKVIKENLRHKLMY